jgi:hypothetical protein
MAITPHEARELAQMLDEGLRCDNARQRLLCVATILQELTDADHPLSNADMRLVIRERFGPDRVPSENTLAADVHALATCGYQDLVVHVTPVGYWCEHTRLSPPKVRLLLNAVQSSRFLTVAQSAELQEDLFVLVSRHQEDDLAGQVHVDQRTRKNYQQVFKTLEVVTRAMNTDRMIEFVYTYSDFNGRAHPLAGDDGATLRIETPLALYYSENNYYVETYTTTPWRHGREVVLSRADRMLDARVSSHPAHRGRVVYDFKRSARRRMDQAFDMVEGPLRRVFFRVRSDATNLLFDRFGFGLRFGCFEGVADDPQATGLTLVQVPQTFTFFRWLASTGGGVVVVEPPSELVLGTGPWTRALKGVSRGELLEDYRNVVQGLLDYLDQARAPYD